MKDDDDAAAISDCDADGRWEQRRLQCPTFSSPQAEAAEGRAGMTAGNG